ncbi:MAG: NUDIX hydrolase [Candidatus Kapabacteria bacterium]|nr:NUDIX hydrolase [Candidatus Kapabacteria bacterium]MDW7996384.1 NUDIX hydrolase [Bacteroidota bacterium]
MAQLQHIALPALWETIGREKVADYGIFTLWRVRRRHPLRQQTGEFVVLEAPTWVNIVPITSEGEIVLIEQYRHGLDALTLEIPGGMVIPGEDPRIAAERECREETGYASDEPAILLSTNYPNPAFLTNVCYSYLWRGCRRVTGTLWDRHEEIAVRLYPARDALQLIRDGHIRHALVLVALFSALSTDITSMLQT